MKAISLVKYGVYHYANVQFPDGVFEGIEASGVTSVEALEGLLDKLQALAIETMGMLAIERMRVSCEGNKSGDTNVGQE